MKIEEYGKKVELWFWQGMNLVKTEWHRYLRLLKWILYLAVGGIGFGVLVSYVGYSTLSPIVINIGRAISGVCSLMATIIAIHLAIRLGATLFVAPIANKAIVGVVREFSRPLPSTPIELPQVIDDDAYKPIVTGFVACYAAVAAFGAFVVVVPVYTLPGYFLALYLLLIFLILGASTWAPTGNWVRRFQKGSLALAVLTIMLFTGLFFAPGVVGRWHERLLLDAAQRQIEAERFGDIQAQIQQKQREKNAVLASKTLTREQKSEQMSKLDQEIEFLRNGGSSWSDWFSGLFGTGTASAAPSASSTSSIAPVSTAGRANTVEMNQNAGPYYKNPNQELIPGEAYKFARDPRVYIYKEDGKLHSFLDEQSYFSYYGCSGNQRVLDCHPVYEMPRSIQPGEPILKGEIIR